IEESPAQPAVPRPKKRKRAQASPPETNVDLPTGPTEQGNGSETEPGQESVPTNHVSHIRETKGEAGEQMQTGKTPKCTFPGKVEISLERFQDGGTQLVECPVCRRTRTLSPHKGVIKFPSHEKRKMTTPNTGQRWTRIDSDWDVVGG